MNNKTTQPLTTEQLNKIEARANAATPGPWTTEWESCDCEDGHCGHGRWPYALVLPEPHTDRPNGKPFPFDTTYTEVSEFTSETAEFIAAAREDVPALLAEVWRLRAQLDTIRELCAPESALGVFGGPHAVLAVRDVLNGGTK